MTRWIRTHPRAALAAYLVLLALSGLAQRGSPATPVQPAVQVAEMTDDGPTDREINLAFLEFGPADDPRPPIILLHGSPGSASNFDLLGPALASSGRRAYALDLPGFGQSTPWVGSYSALAYARTTLAFMDEMGIDRAHVVGWSNGGAVALAMASLRPEAGPERLASITLLAAIASQETEGSGSYHFEHAKYAVGYAGLVILPELVPHFGLLGPRALRHAFVRSFWDTDQRPLRGVMESLDTPVLILHGRTDPLVADWAAERHHELIPTSRLVMTPYSHFMPFLQPQETAGFIEPFLARHDRPGVTPETGAIDLAPTPVRTGFAGAFDAALGRVRATPWWVGLLLAAALARLRRETATALAGLLVGHGMLDFGVAFAGLLAGRAAHTREPWLRRDGRWLAGLPVWTAVSLLIAQLASGRGTPVGDIGPAGLVAWLVLIALLLNAVKLAPTRGGRLRLVARARRLTHHEWWPAWVLYGLVTPRLAVLALRHRSLTCWTCLNPGITPGGGVVGESKQGILLGFDDPRVLPQRRVSSTDGDPAAEARRLVASCLELGGLPVVVKPDIGYRGANVRVARTPEDVDLAARSIGGGVLLQRFHPGPVEAGIFWVRDPETVGRERTEAPQGRVFAVTRKVFPEVVGDGRSTIGSLVLAHARYAMQAGVFFDQLGPAAGRVPAAGERVTLTTAGNHARGCRFEDGSDLITPALSEAIDHLARTWRGPGGEPFDYGRFDVRAASEQGLRDATDLAVIELNAVTSEATNLYDPSWSARRALRLLGDQWAIAFELGARRRSLGGRPMPLRSLIGLVAAEKVQRAVRTARSSGKKR